MSIAATEFDYLRNLLRDRSAMVLDAGKEYLAEVRLAGLLREAGCQSVQHLLATLRTQSDSVMHGKVVDAMTNNETWFFRDGWPFEALKKAVLPELLQKRALERTITIWSAACSAGQEPYSVAMLLAEHFRLPGWKYVIRASDLSDVVLRRAREARYTQLEVNRGLPATMLSRYFTQSGLDWVVKPEIGGMVEFRRLNLAAPWPILPSADVVLLRNVLIYFDLATRKQILARLRTVLRPDGYLFLGGAETTLNLDDTYVRVPFEKTAYYRLR